MNSPVVERVAAALYFTQGHSRPSWADLPDVKRDGYREKVRDVLLAAMNAGLVIREVALVPRGHGIRKCDLCGTMSDVILTDSAGTHCANCLATGGVYEQAK